MRYIIYVLIVLVFLSSCSQGSVSNSTTSSTEPTETFNGKLSTEVENTESIIDTATNADSIDKTEYSTSYYDNNPQSESIGVFYDGSFYGWTSQLRNLDEINSYIEQGEYIGESKEKQIIYNGTSDEPINGGDDWYPDSDLECNGLDAGTPLYRIDNYIVAVYDTPVKDGNLAAHKSDGTQEDIGLYVYGHLYRRETVIEIPSTDTF